MKDNKNKKIILVEDDEYLYEIYEKKFNILGYKPIMTKKGEECLQLVYNEKPDLILLDLMLSDINGMEVLKKIKSDSKVKDVKVYILSNFAQKKEIAAGFKAGADGFIIKANFTPKELVLAVEDIFSGRGVGEKKEDYIDEIKKLEKNK